MEKVYNAKLSFKGEGNFSFILPNYGELTIYRNKDIYVKGLTVSGVEALRQLRPLLLEHQLNAKPDGCYKVIDLSVNTTKTKALENRIQSVAKMPIPVSDLKSSLIKTEGLIPLEDNKRNEDTTIYNPPSIDDEVERLKKELEENDKQNDLEDNKEDDKEDKGENKKDDKKLDPKKDKKGQKTGRRNGRRK